MSRTLIIVGLLIVLIGVGWPWLSKIPLGRLPGDIRVEREGFKFYFPLMTSIVVSTVVSALMYFLRKK